MTLKKFKQEIVKLGAKLEEFSDCVYNLEVDTKVARIHIYEDREYVNFINMDWETDDGSVGMYKGYTKALNAIKNYLKK